MTGQHIEGGETPTWSGRRHRLHHALRFGNEMWASCWHGGFWVVDVSDLARPKSAGSYNYHPLFPEPTHTVMPVPDRIRGRASRLRSTRRTRRRARSEEEARRGRAHACLLTFDVSDLGAIKPLAQFQVSELDSPSAARAARASAPTSSASACPAPSPTPSGSAAGCDHRRRRSAQPARDRPFHPEPVAGRAAPQSNDVALDQRGLIYMVDRHVGFDILEFQG
jgi:hypothetical protein